MRRILMLCLLSVLADNAAAVSIQHWQLANGAQVYFVENHDLPMLDVSVDFPAGSAYDPAHQAGLASLTQRMLDQGAGGMSDTQIAEALANVGAQLSGHFDADRAGIVLRTLTRADDAEPALKIMSKVLEQPVFAEPVVERERARVIDDLLASEGQPQSLAAVAFQKLVFAGQPYGHREKGNIDSVKSLNSADLKSFYRSHYSARAAVIALTGDVTRAQANQIAGQLTANLPPASLAASTAIAPVPALQQSVMKRIVFPSQQSQILIGQPGVARGDPDYVALYVGNYVLGGGGFDSRLMHEVREKRGLTYSVYSYFMPMRQAGAFQIGLQTRADKTAQALAVTQQTLADFVAQGVTAAELTQAQHSIIGGFPLRIDSNQKLLEYLAMIGFYQLPLNYLDTFPDKVAAVTAEQIKLAFQTHIHPDRMVTVVVGNAPAQPSNSKSDGATK